MPLIQYSIKCRVSADSEETARLVLSMQLAGSPLDDFEITNVEELPPGTYHGVIVDAQLEGALDVQTPEVSWTEIGNNLWVAELNNETVRVQLHQRPIKKGEWVYRWVWEGESLYCGEDHWGTVEEAMAAAEVAYGV